MPQVRNLAVAIAQSRGETRAGFAEIRTEIADFKGETRTEFAESRTDLARFKGESKAEFAEVRTEVARNQVETSRKIADLDTRLSGRIPGLDSRMVALETRVGTVSCGMKGIAGFAIGAFLTSLTTAAGVIRGAAILGATVRSHDEPLETIRAASEGQTATLEALPAIDAALRRLETRGASRDPSGAVR